MKNGSGYPKIGKKIWFRYFGSGTKKHLGALIENFGKREGRSLEGKR